MTVPMIENLPAIDINYFLNAETPNDRVPSPGVRTDLPFWQAEYARLDVAASAHCTDTAGGPALLNNSLEFVVETCGADRVLFASGGESLAFAKARVLLSALSREEQEKILLGNALRLFPKLSAWLEGKNRNK